MFVMMMNKARIERNMKITTHSGVVMVAMAV